MIEGRRRWAGLHLLDRQILDRHGAIAGKVDDLELAADPDTGRLHVTALVSGPGALATRLGRRRLGAWLRRVHGMPDAPVDDPTHLALRHVADIGDHVTVSLDAGEVGTAAGERWVRDHVIGHIPGSGRAVE